MKVAIVVGARPNFMKSAPILDAMAASGGLEPVLIHTGQHYDHALSDLLFRQLGMPEPQHHLGIGSAPQSVQTARIMLALDPLLREVAPDAVLVVGDVNSTLAAALVGNALRLPVAHVEAGLRSFDRSMPEETNRLVTDRLSEILFTTEPSANQNLLNEGVSPDSIAFVGNVMIDTLEKHRGAAEALGMADRFGVPSGGFALVTLHRPSNVDDPQVLAGFVHALEGVQERMPVLFPAHPRTLARLREFGLHDSLSGLPGIKVLEALGYLEFLGLMASAALVITDSGGIQEETTILGVPCLTARENTERPITVTAGTNRLVGTDPDAILEAVDEVRSSPVPSPSPPALWDGRASERVVAELESRLGRTVPA